MPDSPLPGWQNFYVIIGSSAAALIGIQFVVIALIANLRRQATASTISAFGTPTVAHLGGALVLAAMMSAPWPSLFSTSVAVAIYGFAGLGYGMIVIGRARRQKDYKPVLEDWLWHAMFPCSIYATLAVASLFFLRTTHLVLFIIGAAGLGLLLIGIHNAWDTVTYLVVGNRSDSTDGF